ncbi:MAG: NifB/NifX family molybdenum-iron cluster-binding protein [Candidatus Omnitrophica bacterium]|nr:NifB/NifX family molybdenum-iron cluster-binding protein [Candidatus Omnitrophota bacterium]
MKINTNKLIVFSILLVAAFGLVVGQEIKEQNNPLVLTGKKAVIVAIAATGKDINSPVSYLFGRAPFYIICDRAKKTYKAVPNKFMDSQHAAGLRSAQMLAGMNVDVVLGNNVGFEPFRVFDAARIEVYTDIHGTAWQALNDFPDGLTKLTAENVPAHFGITNSKKAVACNSFDTQANLGRIVQGKFYICFDCNYRLSETAAGGKMPAKCPKCGGVMHEVVAVTTPLDAGLVKPKVRVF